MKGVDKIVLNLILAHREVNLPEVGALGYRRTAAKLRNKNEILTPVNRAVFFKEPIQGAQSIIELIEQEALCDETEAHRIYKRWLYGARLQDKVVIDGVGEIRNNFFYPLPSTNALLNPLPGAVKLAPRRGWAIISWSIVALLFVSIAGTTGYYYQEIAQYATSVITTPGSIKRPVQTKIVAPEPQPEPEPVVVPEPMIDPATLRYQVVAGVYSTEQNADKFIAKNRLDSLGCIKITLPNGKIMVSVYSSDSREQADKLRQDIRDVFSSAWVYEQKQK